MSSEKKSKGDLGEDYVNQLVYKSYLKEWCYPNPRDLKGNRKEICDLLISFRDVLIIVSVKNYDNNGDYERYKRRVIEKSTNQLYGAERKLFNRALKVIVKHPDRDEEEFDSEKYSKVYRLTINVGEQFEHYDLGDRKENKGFINILNKDTFETILKELDTIKDLVEYLDEREKLLSIKRTVVLKCEEKDLLAIFLKNARRFPDDYYSSEYKQITFELSQAWKNYDQNNPSVQLKREADKESYFIDQLVKEDVLKIPKGEVLAKELMSLSRLERRMVAKSLFSLVGKYEKSTTELARRYSEYNEVGFVFIYYDRLIPEKDFDSLLPIVCEIYHYKRKPNTGIIIILAATNGLKQWKFGYFKGEFPIPKEHQQYLDSAISSFGWFTSEEGIKYEEKEYPDEE